MPQLSVVIITFNEEKNIARCLESIREVADDVVVVDSFSRDKTQAICEQYKVNFIQRKWEGYSATKNFANAQAKFDWILSLDADEALSDELKKSILEIKKQDVQKVYKFNRLTNYCGEWIKHCGWYPDTKIRIFDRRTAQWEGTIHEKLVINEGEPQQLKGDCLHYSYYTIEEHYRQSDKFSSLSAESLYAKGKNASAIKLYLSPLVKFFNTFVLKLGFLDGNAGYTVCKIMASSTYRKYAKLRMLNDKNKVS
ncbi:MAG: glycosyltransferase family 2 protein [Bacteroidetes bacterium]|jgi:glycosyltransferase involved in cell wall biosynthesis|nr:glycosyltransferase family 2 protein [Bacteroidota bacterium]